MKVVCEQGDAESGTFRLVVGKDELALIANALNEICNGIEIEDFEFSARLGVERSEARKLLAEVGAALDAPPPSA
jgi:hypothetical protein